MGKEYSEVQIRKAIGAAYKILSDSRNEKRYSETQFGLGLYDDPESGLSYYDVLDCLALKHNEMKRLEQ